MFYKNFFVNFEIKDVLKIGYIIIGIINVILNL